MNKQTNKNLSRGAAAQHFVNKWLATQSSREEVQLLQNANQAEENITFWWSIYSLYLVGPVVKHHTNFQNNFAKFTAIFIGKTTV